MSEETSKHAAYSSLGDVVKYAPFASTAEASFWTKLADLKLNTLRLNEGPVPIYGSYGPQASRSREDSSGSINFNQPARMRFDHSSVPSFTATSDGSNVQTFVESTTNHLSSSSRNDGITCRGTITILNTVEAFKRIDKNKLLTEEFHSKLLKCMSADEDLSILSTFHCLSFLDLKNYTTLYWFAFPALSPKDPVRYFYPNVKDSIRSLRSAIGDQACEEFARVVFQMRIDNVSQGSVPYSCPPFFIAINVKFKEEELNSPGIKCFPLSHENYMSLTDDERQNCTFCFVDPSSVAHNPGWPMRNLLSYLALRLGVRSTATKPVQIIAFRPGGMRRINSDVIDSYRLGGEAAFLFSRDDASLFMSISLDPSSTSPQADWTLEPETYTSTVGWELNARSKPGPRIINLASIFDQGQLASQSVDLNLQLMKWRLLPNLNTEMLAHNTKCLLLGAGTLGCNVARTLLGWGVRNITLVDGGRVSYSNPVRQSLFEIADCYNGGKEKARAAADALKRIFPDVNATGVVLNIPMPGHSLGNEGGIKEAQESVKILDELIQSHDVTFLLTDTRESRWLPTVAAAAHDKLLINAALGLDSWLVIRHGGGFSDEGPPDEGSPPNGGLGCYFCNDVVAPENSARERTLDQQCTVTRPGLAPIASSIAVELMVALLHTEGRHRTMPPSLSTASHAQGGGGNSELGIVPHQIRGFLSSYTLMTPTTPRFQCCTACSFRVVSEYKSSGFALVQRVSEDSGGSYLEDLTGLSEFKKCAEDADVEWDEDDSSSEENG